MSRGEVSYFDILPQWQASSHAGVRSQRGTDVSESADRTSITKITDESNADSGYETETRGNLTVPTKRRQALEDKCITQVEINKLENQLNRTTIICTSLFCVNIVISGVMFLNFMKK